MNDKNKKPNSDAASRKTSGEEDLDASGKETKISEEEIDYNIMGSFPASDPPSWTLGVRPNKKPATEFEGEKPSPKDPTHQNNG